MVKIHQFGENVRQVYQRAVILVRDPFSSMLAEFNRLSGGHTGYASTDKYVGREWKNFVYSKAIYWEQFNLDWYNGFSPKDRLVVFYDHLKKHPERELRRLLDFLAVHVSNSTLRCVLARDEGMFKRSRKPLDFDPFDGSMRSLVTEKQKVVYRILQINDDDDEFGIGTEHFMNNTTTFDKWLG